jgi:BirA family biotin operon repressor/biotin-[acetyl-CoA-carboxylase] ligase
MNVSLLEEVLGEYWQVLDSGSTVATLSEKVCFFYSEIDSTSDEAQHLDSSYFKAPRKANLLLAQKQTAGHGRLGRPWHAAEGSALTMTLLYRQPVVERPLGHVPLLVGWSILRALGSHVPWKDLDLKWPNDILIQGKKVGGILCSAMNKSGQTWLSLGIGVNIGAMEFPPGLKSIATSVAHHSSSLITVTGMAQSIVECLEEDLEQLSPSELLKNVQGKSSICFGEEISYLEGDIEKFGTTCGLDAEGAFLCRSASGSLHPLHVSEVHRVKRV